MNPYPNIEMRNLGGEGAPFRVRIAGRSLERHVPIENRQFPDWKR